MTEQNQEAPDMGTVERVFQHASNAIVEASQLRRDFGQLRGEFDTLREDMSKLRRQNEFLDEQLTHVRQQRDDANRKVNELESKLYDSNNRVVDLERLRDENSTTIAVLHQRINDSSRERDDAQLRVMELEESEGKLRAKLAEVEAKAAEIAKLFAPQAGELQASTVLTAGTAVTIDPMARQVGESEEQHRERTQPRDPVTQQWRSPYDAPQRTEPWPVETSQVIEKDDMPF